MIAEHETGFGIGLVQALKLSSRLWDFLASWDTQDQLPGIARSVMIAEHETAKV
jgi:hypothetical protein